MTINNLYEILKNILEEDPSKGNMRVCVHIDEPSIGPSAKSEVKSCTLGFDWDDGTFILYQEDNLYRNKA